MLIVETSVTLTPKDRLQICISKGYDKEVVLGNLRLCPMLFRVKETIFKKQAFTLLTTVPRGIHLIVLKANEKDKPYYADVFSGHYSRLKLDRKTGTAGMIIGNEDDDVLIEDLQDTRQNPLVVSGNFSVETGSFELIIAAPKTWYIKREEQCDIKIAADPYNIPSFLRELLNTKEQSTRTDKEGVKTLWLKLKNIDEMAIWYGDRVLAESTREELTLLHGKFKGKLTEVEANLPTETPAMNNLEFETTVRKVLNEEFGKAKSKEILSKVIDLMHPKLLDERKGNIKTLDDFISLLYGMPYYELFKNLIIKNQLPDLPANRCSKCNSATKIRIIPVRTNNLSKDLTCVQCSECNEKLNRNDWGTHNQAVAVWNKQHPSLEPPILPDAFNFQSDNRETINKGIKSLFALNNRARVLFKSLAIADQTRMNKQDINVRIQDLELWCNYIKSTFAHHTTKQLEANRRA
jgi:hypothetical protein